MLIMLNKYFNWKKIESFIFCFSLFVLLSNGIVDKSIIFFIYFIIGWCLFLVILLKVYVLMMLVIRVIFFCMFLKVD